MKIKKSASTETIFNGNTSLKIVLPCKNEKDKNDNIIKELIAYKIYEIVSPYHSRPEDYKLNSITKLKKVKKNMT